MTVQEDRNLLVFTGNANRPLAEAVCRELGIRLGKAQVGRFSLPKETAPAKGTSRGSKVPSDVSAHQQPSDAGYERDERQPGKAEEAVINCIPVILSEHGGSPLG